jgi:TRAP-type transport system periplasmic protein
MKKNAWITVVVGLTLVFTGSALSQAETITLTLSDQHSEYAWGSVHALQPWVKQVERASRGQVKIQIYPNQTLSRGEDNWDAVKNGFADIGWCSHGYWPGMTPLADVISLPALPFKSAEKGSEVLWKLYEMFPTMQRQFEENHVLVLYASPPQTLITTQKRVKTLEDVRGLKIRATKGPPADQILAMGGTPMLIPMPDTYVSLQMGTIDGTGASYEAILGLRLYEVTKFYTEVPFPADYFSIVMNKNKWDSLSQGVKEAMTSVSGLQGAQFWGRNSFDTAKEALFQKSGVEINFFSLPDVERDRWREIGGEPVWNQWVNSMKEMGFPEAQDILMRALDMMK